MHHNEATYCLDLPESGRVPMLRRSVFKAQLLCGVAGLIIYGLKQSLPTIKARVRAKSYAAPLIII
eukprot:7211228-Alexandrium_andersonii.AAC.1